MRLHRRYTPRPRERTGVVGPRIAPETIAVVSAPVTGCHRGGLGEKSARRQLNQAEHPTLPVRHVGETPELRRFYRRSHHLSP